MFRYKIMTTVQAIFWLHLIYPKYNFQAEKGVHIVYICVLYSSGYGISQIMRNTLKGCNVHFVI